jgi:signal transduction histidine kinase
VRKFATDQELSILLVSRDPALRDQVRRELQIPVPEVVLVSTLDAARQLIQESQPTVILLDEKSLEESAQDGHEKHPRLDSVVACLAGYAPVVVIAAERHKKDMESLVAAGAADYVEHRSGCLPAALKLVERRLRNAGGGVVATLEATGTLEEEFGEVMRHELNNPLTGILGNAELLLAEVRRKEDGRMPGNTQQRLETIAALAVRMRETVRRLSQQLETR